MARVAKTREQERLSYALNPASGAVLEAQAGGQAEAEFEFYNDSPDVASFYLEAEGLPQEWLSGVGTAFESYAAASGGGQLRLTLHPPVMATVGEYDFKVRIVSGGMAVAGDVALVLRVDAAPEGVVEVLAETPEPNGYAPSNGTAVLESSPIIETPPIITESVVDPPLSEAPVLEPPTAEPAPKTPRVRTARTKSEEATPIEPVAEPEITYTSAETVAPLEPVVAMPVSETPILDVRPVAAPVVVAPAPEPIIQYEPQPTPPMPEPKLQAPPIQQAPPPPVEPKPQPVQQAPPPPVRQVPPPPVRPMPQPVQPAPQPRAQTPPPVQPVTPPVQQATPTPRPTPTPAPSRPAPAPTRPAPAPEPEEEPVLIDYNTRSSATGVDVDGDEEDQTVTEAFQLDPKEGTVIALCPGDTMLLRFPFTNAGTREQTYILDEDRALEDGWLTLVQDQVNLTRNGSGELSIRLTPPQNADPGDYPFTVTLGPQGGTLTSRSIVLSVLATPAVRLTVKDKTVKVGPMAPYVEFPMAVETAGNADTAFRVSVKAPQTDDASSGTVTGTGDIYETPQWRYLFDKEMESLRAPASGREPRPVPVVLRVRPKGIWWFGFKQTHQVRVAAVPVTEPNNGGKKGNIVDLTAVRSRYLPFPVLLLIPIFLLILMFFSGGASDLSVTNSQYAQGNTYWVVEPKDSLSKQLNLSWQARPLAMLRLTGTPEGTDTPKISKVRVGSGTFDDIVQVSTSSRDVAYHYRISRLIGGGDQDAIVHYIYTSTDAPLQVSNGTTKQALTDKNITLTVPNSGYARLNFTNGAHQESRLDWWLVKGLGPSDPYKFSYIKNLGSLEPGQTEHFLIGRSGQGDTSQPTQIVLVTTDANHSVITVTLKPAP